MEGGLGLFCNGWDGLGLDDDHNVFLLFFFFFFFLRSPAISLGFTTFWVRFLRM